jgi:transcription-repair coupling factor (superfamily II helicase)
LKALTAPLTELGEYDEIEKQIKGGKGNILLTGCADSQKSNIAYALSEEFRYRLILTFDEVHARSLYEDFEFYDRNVMLYPAKDLIFYQADVHGNQLSAERIRCMRSLIEGRRTTVITTYDSILAPLVPLEAWTDHIITVKKGSRLDEEETARRLTGMGYESAAQIEEPGQFSIRGDIIDIFDLTEENPYRIELWDDEVDSVRSFDLDSQRSIEQLESVSIYPASEMVLSEDELTDGIARIEKECETFSGKLRKEFHTEEAHRISQQVAQLREQLIELGMPLGSLSLDSYIRYFYKATDSLLGYFPGKDTCVFLDEPSRIEEHNRAVITEFNESMTHRIEKGYILPGQADILYDPKKAESELSGMRTVMLSVIDMAQTLLRADKKYDVQSRDISSYNNSFEALVRDLNKYKKEKYRVVLLSGSRTRARRLAGDLSDQGLNAFYSENPDRVVKPGEIMAFFGHARRGFEYPLLKFVVISETDIFGAEKKKKRRKLYEGQKIKDFSQLHPGDYVVHESHGLGIYRGIEKVEVEHVTKDYMKIEYRDGGVLYIPATGLDLLQKYASADSKSPKLNKLGSQEWNKTKSKVKSAVNEVAQDLVELYAERQNGQGYHFGTDTVWQKEFEEMFPYEETADQLNAIDAVKSDMESGRIMDRLICGDVGYGKTEVAIRAAFKAVQDGKQVVFLVPTTILAQQHYNTFVQRMKNYPVRVDLLSRFRTSAEQHKTIQDLASGLVDIVIGTHRVLSKDIRFKDLGLLIVDEEQRFGVTHKEKIKKMRKNVDVLTLTATPIPRTLHMSLAGIRDMSILEEAPDERQPIQTFVCEYNDELVREAVIRELARNGQVYYVYNRVDRIADIAAEVQRLVPEANVAFAHGQMQEHELERIMYDFVNGDIDVLVSTTIIETGLDISNVNTIIVHDSDRMGLAQLYQLRGRVGRSNRTAYAFLMYRKDKMLQETAEKRLAAIKEFTDLGSGIKIAMKDLEIRGAGNILGARQSGHMQAVGYDLYCKMLNEAVRNLKGENVERDFDTTIDLEADAYIPDTYIVNEVQKLDIYKRIAGIETQEQRADMQDELADRFGEVPQTVDNLLRISLIRVQAHKLFMTEVKGRAGVLTFTMLPDGEINVDRIPEVLNRCRGSMKFSPKGKPVFTYRYYQTGIGKKDEEELLGLTEKLVSDIFSVLVTVKETAAG